MPYIENKKFNKVLLSIGVVADNAGELNYQLTMMIKRYTDTKGLSYQTINDVVGALEGAKAEYQRRVVGPYEDKKIAENGDVY